MSSWISTSSIVLSSSDELPIFILLLRQSSRSIFDLNWAFNETELVVPEIFAALGPEADAELSLISRTRGPVPPPLASNSEEPSRWNGGGDALSTSFADPMLLRSQDTSADPAEFQFLPNAISIEGTLSIGRLCTDVGLGAPEIFLEGPAERALPRLETAPKQ